MVVGSGVAQSVSVSSGFYTDYMWRGFNLYEGSSIQPSIDVSYEIKGVGTLGANLWSHLSAEGSSQKEANFGEVDYTLSYTTPFKELELSFGHMWYTFPYEGGESIPDSAEFYGSLTIPVMLNPSLSYYYDYDYYNYSYYELGLSHELKVSDSFSIVPVANFGFAAGAEKVYANDGFVQTTFGVEMPVSLDSVSINPKLMYTRENDDVLESEFWAGFDVGYQF
jgi:hypothetical protein